MMRNARIIAVAATILLVAGCGGGGSSTAFVGNQPAPDMPAKFGGALQMLTSLKQCFTQAFMLDPETGLATVSRTSRDTTSYCSTTAAMVIASVATRSGMQKLVER